jgi:hypothetical protein
MARNPRHIIESVVFINGIEVMLKREADGELVIINDEIQKEKLAGAVTVPVRSTHL